jgi:ATP-dependent DNA helicase RecQ
VHRAGDIACDEALFERLRQLRKQLADERGLPPYIVFSDVSLRQMAREYPQNEREFARISGVGERKLSEFGTVFLGEIAAHLRSNPRQIFADDSFASMGTVPVHARLTGTTFETLRRFREGASVEQIANERGLTVVTIYGHLADAMVAGEAVDLRQFLTSEQEREISDAFQKNGFGSLGIIFESLGGRYEYGRLKLVRATLQRK